MYPFISIILTTHNRPSLLIRALTSILKQNFQDYEIILCSDESSVETKKIATSLLRANDSFLCVPGIKGPSESRNLGVRVARGRWICFLDDDDTFVDTFFIKAVEYLKDLNKIYYFHYIKLFENRKDGSAVEVERQEVTQLNLTKEMLYIGNSIPINTLIISSDIAKRFEFDSNLETHEDWDWIMAILNLCKTELSLIPEISSIVHLAESDMETRNNCKSRDVVHALDFLSIYRKWPAISSSLKLERAKVMQARGLAIPSEYL